MNPDTNNMINAYNKGFKAEDIAAEYLSDKMYDVLARRMKTKYGEIDLICKYKNTIVAVEVKYRKDGSTIYECISDKQRRRISMAFLSLINNYTGEEYRIDVVYIYNGVIEHVENAFYIENYIAY